MPEGEMAAVIGHEKADDKPRPHCRSIHAKRGLLISSLRPFDLFPEFPGQVAHRIFQAVERSGGLLPKGGCQIVLQTPWPHPTVSRNWRDRR